MNKKRIRAPEYKAFIAMKYRCLSPNQKDYKYYGGRGVTVCAEWMAEGGYKHFIAHIGLKPDPLLTLDRIDTNRGYEPGNVRWADRRTQSINRRKFKMTNRKRKRPSHLYRGEFFYIEELCKISGLTPRALESRLARGWPMDKAVETPRLRLMRGPKPANEG